MVVLLKGRMNREDSAVSKEKKKMNEWYREN